MNSEGPTVFLEPKALYNDPLAETVVPEDFEVPLVKPESAEVAVI